MHAFTLLLILPFLRAEYLQNNIDSADSGLWDLTISPLEASNSISDGEEFPFQNVIGLDDFPLMAGDDDSSAMFGEIDPYTIAMDQCSSSSSFSSFSPDGIFPGRRLRTRGEAFCTDSGNGEQPVNPNPSLAGLDSSESIIDPDNRRQCDDKFVTLCCESPLMTSAYVEDCHYCEFFIP